MLTQVLPPSKVLGYLRLVPSTQAIQHNKNEDAMNLLITDLRQRLEEVHEGGGLAAMEKHKARGKMTARERITALLDLGKDVIEIGALAGDGMYVEDGGCPSAGVVVVMGYIEGRLCVVVANDATVKAGAWFPITGKKNLRAQEIAIENRIPIIYLVDSAGVYLPMQDDIFPDKEHFGRIFRNNAVMSSMGITQIAAIMGSCVAGGAYLPIMSDEALIVEGTGSIYLAGPYLVKAAIGEEVDSETLGGAETTTAISGITDYKMPDDATCLRTIRKIISKLGGKEKAGFDRIQSMEPAVDGVSVNQVIAADNAKPYEMMGLINALVDESAFTEYKGSYGKTILCGYARVDGWAVGILANQRKVIKSKTGEMQVGGVIYSDSADKAARFIMNCNQKRIPLVFLQDVTGFMVGKRSEHGGIIKDGAKLVSAVANSIVPKFTIVVGNSYGAGNYAMCGKAYDPRLIVAWPTAKIAVMGGEQAAKTLLQIQVATLKKKGEKITPEKEKELLDRIISRYETQTTPYYAAARLWVDAIIEPVQTRNWISLGIEAANHAPITREFSAGVLQT